MTLLNLADARREAEVPMSSTPSPTQSEFPIDRLPAKPSIGRTGVRPIKHRFPSKPVTASPAFAYSLMMFLIGVAATLAWQSYGGTVRETIARSSPHLGWLAPQAERVTETAAQTIDATPSPDQRTLEAMSLDLAALRHSVSQLAASHKLITRRVEQLAASQEQMTNDITKLQAVEQNILSNEQNILK